MTQFQKKIFRPLAIAFGLLMTLIPIPLVMAQSGQAQTLSLSDLYESVNPVVVTIESLERKIVPSMGPQEQIAQSVGTGFIISADGLVMTAAHVVNLADSMVIKFHDGQKSTASIVSSIPLADVALLKLHTIPPNMKVATLGDAGKVRIGDPIVVIGAPQGIRHTLSFGHISGHLRGDQFAGSLMPIEYLQTDAAINRGNSGGPMFNLDGEVIAVTSRIVSESGGSEGLGFGVNINAAKHLLLESEGLWAGFETHLVDGELAKVLNLPQKAGLLIQRVAANSFGAKVGLRPSTVPGTIRGEQLLLGGDIILSINDTPVTAIPSEMPKLSKVFHDAVTHGQATLRVMREGQIIDFVLK